MTNDEPCKRTDRFEPSAGARDGSMQQRTERSDEQVRAGRTYLAERVEHVDRVVVR